MDIYDAYLDKINNPGDWLERKNRRPSLTLISRK